MNCILSFLVGMAIGFFVAEIVHRIPVKKQDVAIPTAKKYQREAELYGFDGQRGDGKGGSYNLDDLG